MKQLDQLVRISEETLSALDEIEKTADSLLASRSGYSGMELAYGSENAQFQYSQIRQGQYAVNLHVSRVPAKARITLRTSYGKEITVYISETESIPIRSVLYASYQSPVGYLASQPVGTECVFNKERCEIIENTTVNPIKELNSWDSHNSVVKRAEGRTVTIQSMRSLIHTKTAETPIDSAKLIKEGIQKSQIQSFSFARLPILDEIQDKLFRASIHTSRVLLGPPGTGKTTILIQRIKQKTGKYRTEEEKRLITNSKRIIATDIPKNGSEEMRDNDWILFTPSNLLRDNLKLACERELGYSINNVTTWDSYRSHCLQKFSSFNESHVFQPIFNSKQSFDDQRTTFEAFDKWQREFCFEKIKASALSFKEDVDSPICQRIASSFDNKSILDYGFIINSLLVIVLEYLDPERFSRKCSSHLKTAINRLPSEIIDDLNHFVYCKVNRREWNPLDKREYDESSKAELQEVLVDAMLHPGDRITGKTKVLRKYYLGWAGLQHPEIIDAVDRIKKEIDLSAELRKLLSTLRLTVFGVMNRYVKYRKTLLFSTLPMTEDDADFIILATLMQTSDILEFADNELVLRYLSPICSVLRTQVFADEISDFSYAQASIMYYLSPPKQRSVFACGDLHQCMKSNGIRNTNDLLRTLHCGITSLSRVYRQSKKLIDFATELVNKNARANSSKVVADFPEDYTNIGVYPICDPYLTTNESKVEWLNERILEIQSCLGNLPSIAIFVNREDQIAPITEQLSQTLDKRGLQYKAVPCLNGIVKDRTSNDIRVFSIKHIKGLEFEAAFVLDIDELKKIAQDEFVDYLYVAATRAAYFLGLSSSSNIPSELKGMNNTALNWKGV